MLRLQLLYKSVPPSNIISTAHILDGEVLSFNYSFDEIKIKQRSQIKAKINKTLNYENHLIRLDKICGL